MSLHECPCCRSYNCYCSRHTLDDYHRRHRFDMSFGAERDIKQKIRRMEDDERMEEMRREEEEEQERERVRADRQRQEREEEEAYWEAQREQDEG